MFYVYHNGNQTYACVGMHKTALRKYQIKNICMYPPMFNCYDDPIHHSVVVLRLRTCNSINMQINNIELTWKTLRSIWSMLTNSSTIKNGEMHFMLTQIVFEHFNDFKRKEIDKKKNNTFVFFNFNFILSIDSFNLMHDIQFEK